ncbi:MAG: argininosuccinate lyase [Acidobacteriota bacterium]
MTGGPPNAGPARLWGGRFAKSVDRTIDDFTSSLPFDQRLAAHDIVGSMAHARMLYEQGVLDRESAEPILDGLSALLSGLEGGTVSVQDGYEDVHSWIEGTLIERLGDPGRRLHTGRSRNDQTGTALRLYLRDEVAELVGLVSQLLETLRAKASEHTDTLLPGYTHLQRGQPVSLAHHLLAHFWFLEADAQRLMRAHGLAGTSVLGAGALAGSPHDIDPERSAELLGFERTLDNSMHAVADRDYVVETCFACALVLVHLSRWAEEVILWTSAEFGFAQLDDAAAKGSSIMPQKKNPEPLEVLRGKSGRAVGDLMAHLMQLKGLPLTYNSDLQEDKEALFDALETARAALTVANVVVQGLSYDADRMAAALYGSFVTATDLADALVKRGLPFREAHEQTGAAVRAAEEAGVELWELPLDTLRACCPLADESIYAGLDPASSVAAHDSFGGPAPQRVREQLERAVTARDAIDAWRTGRVEPPVLRAHRAGTLSQSERLAVEDGS